MFYNTGIEKTRMLKRGTFSDAYIVFSSIQDISSLLAHSVTVNKIFLAENGRESAGYAIGSMVDCHNCFNQIFKKCIDLVAGVGGNHLYLVRSAEEGQLRDVACFYTNIRTMTPAGKLTPANDSSGAQEWIRNKKQYFIIG